MIIVTDCETTGIDDGSAVVEVAAVPVRPAMVRGAEPHVGWRIGSGASSLVTPGRLISCEAMATHHLTNEMLREAPQLPQAVREVLRDAAEIEGPMMDNPEEQLIVVAHNAEFDKPRLDPAIRATTGEHARVIWLCTYRLSLHLYPDAPSHKNQVLRYYIPGADAHVRMLLGAYSSSEEMAPHRALYDAVTTAVILRHMLERHDLSQLLEMQEHPVVLTTVRFGKHRGAKWSEVPRDYLGWVLRQDFDRDVQHTARHFLGR